MARPIFSVMQSTVRPEKEPGLRIMPGVYDQDEPFFILLQLGIFVH